MTKLDVRRTDTTAAPAPESCWADAESQCRLVVVQQILRLDRVAGFEIGQGRSRRTTDGRRDEFEEAFPWVRRRLR
ncbi:MAG: hypothetical protein WA891_05440 [Acidobacteriaceae bacterium]